MPKKKKTISAAQQKRNELWLARYKKEQAEERARVKRLKTALSNAEWWMRKALKDARRFDLADIALDAISLVNKAKFRI